MQIRFVGAIVVILGGIVVAEPLLACGEKFLVSSRGTRFQRAAAAPTNASILVYANATLNLPKALPNVPLDDTLRKAGYRPTIVASPEEFTTAMRRGGWDLVLVDLAESRSLTTRSQDPAAPIVLPVAFNASKQDLEAAKKQHHRILKTPTQTYLFLDAINEALASKPPKPAQAKGNSGR